MDAVSQMMHAGLNGRERTPLVLGGIQVDSLQEVHAVLFRNRQLEDGPDPVIVDEICQQTGERLGLTLRTRAWPAHLLT